MAQLVVEAALARQQRPPVDRGAERSFAYARVRTATTEFFATPVWQLVEETAQRKSHNALGDVAGGRPRAAPGLGAGAGAARGSGGAAAAVLRAPLPHHPPAGPPGQLIRRPVGAAPLSA